jgi:N-acetylglucosaminyldiphosphoundecaprenol N-acetyl-beta-D-mannosaminyltransferase
MDNLFGITIKSDTKNSILEKIENYFKNPHNFFHIVSLNPENLVISLQNQEFRKVLNDANVQIIDGVGVLLGCSILGIKVRSRLTGVDFMDQIIDIYQNGSLRVLFLGGRPRLADKLTKCYKEKYPNGIFLGISGIEHINNPKEEEERNVMKTIESFKPHIIFASFGSPAQELWFWRKKEDLNGIICMGVGGAFDFIVGDIPRAPKLIRRLGLEWLFRLIIEPWRWKRQLRLIVFMWYVLKQKITGKV